MLAFTLRNEAVAEDEAAVAQAVEGFRKAMQANDRAQFEALCAPQLSYGHSAGKIQTKAEFIAEATSGKSTWKSREFSDVKTSVAGNNAITRFMLTGRPRAKASRLPSRSAWCGRSRTTPGSCWPGRLFGSDPTLAFSH
jgi:hypothetical protein